MKERKDENDLDISISSWSEEDVLNGEVVRSFTIILKTIGCSWSKKLGCTMCGYSNDCPDTPVSDQNMFNQINRSLEKIDDENYIKIFTSGSFMDEDEISRNAAEGIIKLIHDNKPDSRILIETRPEFVSEERMNRIRVIHEDIEIAIGLEDSSNEVLSSLVRKGFTYSDYLKAGRIIVDGGFHLKTYLLLKPPFLGEERSIEHTLSSIEKVHDNFPGSCISINPMNIQRGTEVEKLHLKGIYRTPWLWSLIEVLKEGHDITGGETRLMSSPTGAGKSRGAHNCGKCDRTAMEGIDRYSLTGDPVNLVLEEGCCLEEWRDYRKRSLITTMDPGR